MNPSLRALGWTAVVLASSSLPAAAQVAKEWQIPDEMQEVDLTSKKLKPTLISGEEVLEVPLEFSMIQRSDVKIQAELPKQPGRFDIQLGNSKALVELKDVRREENQGKAEVHAKVAPLGMEQASRRAAEQIDEMISGVARRKAERTAEGKDEDFLRAFLRQQGAKPMPHSKDVRELYIRVRALEDSADELREKLFDAAKNRGQWFTSEQKQHWAKAKVGELVAEYHFTLGLEIAEAHLSKCGFNADVLARTAAKNLAAMFEAVHVLMSGRLSENPESGKALKALNKDDLDLLKQSLVVSLKIRFHPEAETSDANAQWFSAQRVMCRASGIASIRVEGTLDPDKNDRVDWWILEHYNPDTTKLVTSTEDDVRFDSPVIEEGVARLKISAKGKKGGSYWFEIPISEKPGALKVVIQESSTAANVKFPF